MNHPGSAGPQPGTAQEAEPGLGVPTCKGWHSRGYLPHCDASGLLQSITFRMADALPQERLAQLEKELESTPAGQRDAARRQRIEQWLDAGMGSCALRHPRMAAVMQETLWRFDGQRYRLIAWCVMPNHVHVLIEPRVSLGKIVQSWKSFTGRWGIEHWAELGLGVPVPGGAFWMRDYWDRYIRDERHLQTTIQYIHDNPVKAGLCDEPQAWRWSSAAYGGDGMKAPAC